MQTGVSPTAPIWENEMGIRLILRPVYLNMWSKGLPSRWPHLQCLLDQAVFPASGVMGSRLTEKSQSVPFQVDSALLQLVQRSFPKRDRLVSLCSSKITGWKETFCLPLAGGRAVVLQCVVGLPSMANALTVFDIWRRQAMPAVWEFDNPRLKYSSMLLGTISKSGF